MHTSVHRTHTVAATCASEQRQHVVSAHENKHGQCRRHADACRPAQTGTQPASRRRFVDGQQLPHTGRDEERDRSATGQNSSTASQQRCRTSRRILQAQPSRTESAILSRRTGKEASSKAGSETTWQPCSASRKCVNYQGAVCISRIFVNGFASPGSRLVWSGPHWRFSSGPDPVEGEPSVSDPVVRLLVRERSKTQNPRREDGDRTTQAEKHSHWQLCAWAGHAEVAGELHPAVLHLEQ